MARGIAMENEQLGKIAYEVRRDLDSQDPHYYDDISGIDNVPVIEWEQLKPFTQARYIRVAAEVKSCLNGEYDDTALGLAAYRGFHTSNPGVVQFMPDWELLTETAQASFISAALAIKYAVMGYPVPAVIIDGDAQPSIS